METSAIFLLKLGKLLDRFNDLEKEISNPEGKMDVTEATLFNDYLNKLYEQLVTNETQLETRLANTSLDLLSTKLTELQPYHLKVIHLRAKLTKIISPTSQNSNANNVYNQTGQPRQVLPNLLHNPLNYPGMPCIQVHQPSTSTLSHIQAASNQAVQQQVSFQKFSPPQTASIQTTQPQAVPREDTLINIQNSLIKRLDSIKIPESIGSVEAELLYNQFTLLYNSFFSNQLLIEANDAEAELKNQQKIVSEFTQKILDAHTKLKKIIKTNDNDEAAQTDTKLDVDSLLKKSESLLQQMKLLEPTETTDAEKAEILYQHLTALHESFVFNQNKIEMQLSGDLLDVQLEISRKTQQKVIDLQSKLKKISTSTAALSTPPQFEEFASKLAAFQLQLDDLSDIRSRFNQLFEMMSDLSKSTPKCSDTNTTHSQHLDVVKDIQSKVMSLQTTLNEIKRATPLPISNPSNVLPFSTSSVVSHAPPASLFPPMPISSPNVVPDNNIWKVRSCK